MVFFPVCQNVKEQRPHKAGLRWAQTARLWRSKWFLVAWSCLQSVDNIYTIHPAGHWSPVWNGYMMPVRDYLLFFVVAAHHHSGIPRPPVQHHGQLATWGLLQASLLSLRNYVWSRRLKYVWACLCSLDCNRKENISAQYESVYFKICVMRLTLHSQQIRKNCWWSGFV